MISIIRGPSYYNPFRHPERALARRNRILDTFLADGLISNPRHQDAIGSSLGVVSSPNSGGAYYPAFMDIVRAELSERYSASDLRSQGLRIFTTLKPREQENAQKAVTSTPANDREGTQIGTGQPTGSQCHYGYSDRGNSGADWRTQRSRGRFQPRVKRQQIRRFL